MTRWGIDAKSGIAEFGIAPSKPCTANGRAATVHWIGAARIRRSAHDELRLSWTAGGRATVAVCVCTISIDRHLSMGRQVTWPIFTLELRNDAVF